MQLNRSTAAEPSVPQDRALGKGGAPEREPYPNPKLKADPDQHRCEGEQELGLEERPDDPHRAFGHALLRESPQNEGSDPDQSR